MAQEVPKTDSSPTSDGVMFTLRGADMLERYRQLLGLTGVHDRYASTVMLLVIQVVGAKLSPVQFLERLADRLGISEDRARSLATSIGAQILLPLKDELSTDPEYLIGQWSETGSTGKPLARAFIEDYVRQLEGVDDTHEQQRYEAIFYNFLSGQVSERETLERMQRSSKLNGLDMDEKEAQDVLTTFGEAVKGKHFDFEAGASAETEKGQEKETAEVTQVAQEDVKEAPVEVSEVVDSASKKKSSVIDQLAPDPVLPKQKTHTEMNAKEDVPQEILPKNSPKSSIDAFTDEDNQEVERVKQQKSSVIQASQVKNVEDVVKAICDHEAFQFDEPTLHDRCVKLVESRVRGVRNPFQAREQFERSVEKGGLGVSGGRLSQLMQRLEEHVRAYEAHYAKGHETLKEQQKEERAQKAQTQEQLAAQEEKHLSKRYAELTGRMPGESVAPAAPKSRRTSAAISAHHELQQREGKIDVERVKDVVQKSKGAATAVARKGSVPSMQEVVFEKRLSGPVDELHRMTLTDFRRLSSDPQQAITKIQDKVDLLESQGHHQKVEAIKAWRESPLNRLYMKLTREAVLNGLPVKEVLSQKRTAGEEIFTDKELEAVMELNGNLRF